MTETELQCLKDNIDKLVEIETVDAELLTAKVISVFDDAKSDEHELLFEVIASNAPDFYARFKNAGGFALDFEDILAVRPLANQETNNA